MKDDKPMMKEITIQPVLNGYLCHVGCQRVVFTDRKTLLASLNEYLDTPEAVEKRFLEQAVNKMEPGPCVADVPRRVTYMTEAQCEAAAQPVTGLGQRIR